LPPKAGLFFGNGTQWLPVLDGVEVTQVLQTRLRQGDFTAVPYLAGANLVPSESLFDSTHKVIYGVSEIE
jgi:hypothetical protein